MKSPYLGANTAYLVRVLASSLHDALVCSCRVRRPTTRSSSPRTSRARAVAWSSTRAATATPARRRRVLRPRLICRATRH
eukprot:6185712-Pleurochrysis_carterae.AAC.1